MPKSHAKPTTAANLEAKFDAGEDVLDYFDLSAEKAKLAKLGIDFEKLSDYHVICLPENAFSFEKPDDIYDASDARHLAKLLKASNVRCATAFDLGLDVPNLERRSNDLWLGVLWLLGSVALPVVINVISSLITSKPEKKNDKRVQPTVHIELFIQRGPNVTKFSYREFTK